MEQKTSYIIGIVTAILIGSAFLPFLNYIPNFQASENTALAIFGTMLVPVIVIALYNIFKGKKGE